MLENNGEGEATLTERDARAASPARAKPDNRGAAQPSDELKTRAPSKTERPPEREEKPEPPSGDDGRRQDKTIDKHGKSFFRRHPVLSSIGAIVLLLVLAGGYLYLDYSQHFESTDDAFVAARAITIAPKVSGYVIEVPVTDNEHVPAGGVIARIDDRDYRIALEQADAQVSAAQAALNNVDAQIAMQQAQIDASQAQVDQARAALQFAQQQAARYEELAQKGSGTVQNAQQYSSQLLQQQAALKSAEAGLNVARRQLESLKAQRGSAQANLDQAVAQRNQARLNLSYTVVTAAEAGRVVSLTAAPGQFAQAGTSLSMFVPDEIWITANFKETQLDLMRPGQPATISIDAYPERDVRGHVASVQPGSGTAFSLLPAQNATGNYVKIVQRVPVKIIMDNPPTDVALGPGMSVVPTVRVDPNPSLYERLF